MLVWRCLPAVCTLLALKVERRTAARSWLHELFLDRLSPASTISIRMLPTLMRHDVYN